MSNQQTLQQKRAASAWKQIAEVEKLPEKTRKEYGSLVRGLPAMIQTDGLGATLAFMNAKAKEKEHHRKAYQHLAAWVVNEMGASGDLLQWLIGRGSSEYRQATAEALAYLHWLKRFAEAKDWKSEEK